MLIWLARSRVWGQDLGSGWASVQFCEVWGVVAIIRLQTHDCIVEGVGTEYTNRCLGFVGSAMYAYWRTTPIRHKRLNFPIPTKVYEPKKFKG